MSAAKTEQLQIRVSKQEKRAIQQRAKRAGASVSEWLLSRALPTPARRFREHIEALGASDEPGFALAEILDWLAALSRHDFEQAVAEPPPTALDDYWANYLAATLEHAAALKNATSPAWTRSIPPLAEPVFGSSLASLRLHLLLNSPAAFAARNLFIDASVGQRV